MSKLIYEPWIERNIREYGNCFVGVENKVKQDELDAVLLELAEQGYDVVARVYEKDIVIERC